MKEVFQQIFCTFNNMYSVIIEDDGRVCYAYLLNDDNIVGDVWVYNTIATPTGDEWPSKSELPFLNLFKYIGTNNIQPIKDSAAVAVDWVMTGKELMEVNIYIGNQLVVRLAEGQRPGWSAIVMHDGPLAKKMQ